MFKVVMVFDFGEFAYGTYDDQCRANEVAMMVRAERGCEVYVEKV